MPSANASRPLIEVVLLWGRDVVEVRHLDEQCPRLTVGTGVADDLFVPLPHAASVELLARTSHGWLLRPLDAGAPTLIGDDVDVSYRVGPFTLRVRSVERARHLMLAPVFDALWANVFTVTMFAMAATVALALFLPKPLSTNEPDIAASPRFMALMLRPPPPPAAKAPLSAAEPAKTARASTSAAQPARPRISTKPAASGAQARSDEQIVAAKLTALFGEHARSLVNSEGASGGAFVAALQDVAGVEVAMAGLALKGAPLSSSPSSSASLSSTGTIALARVGTRGHVDGDVGYGDAGGMLAGREDRDVTVSLDTPPLVTGALDKEIIRRVVRDHMSQVRACYERELQSDAGLAGKVTLRWSIAADGKVAQAGPVDGTTLQGVGDCIARAARGWRFPAPRGGGTVVVVYPFVFKST